MAKNTPVEPVEPAVPANRKRLRTAAFIAGGVLALGATFAAGAAIGERLDGPRGEHDRGDRDGDRGMSHGPQGGPGGDRDVMHGQGEPMPDETAPAPDVTP